MTRDHARQALVALAVYCERGEAALRSFRADDPEGATAALSRRSAAFHNFRALDELARTSGTDLASNPEALALIAKIRDLDAKLVPLLEAAKDRALEQSTKVREARAKLARFRSGSESPSGNGFSHGA